DDLFERQALGGEDGFAEEVFELFGELVDTGLGLVEGRFGGEQVELDLATVSQDSGLNIRVLPVDGGALSIDDGFGQESDAQKAAGDVARRQNRGEAIAALAF